VDVVSDVLYITIVDCAVLNVEPSTKAVPGSFYHVVLAVYTLKTVCRGCLLIIAQVA
jgi:hypothetical protein